MGSLPITRFLVLLMALSGLAPDSLAKAARLQQATEPRKPLWEIALGFGLINQPYYIGSNQYRRVPFPVIFPVYRGEIFKSDRDGLRAEIIKDPRYKLDLGLGFNFAIDSDNIDARKGMDDIGNFLLQGPALEVKAYQQGNDEVELKFPLLVPVEFGGESDGVRGLSFAPSVSFRRKFRFFSAPLRASLSAGLRFGTDAYHEIYYSVPEEFATADRPAYRADTGFSGYRLNTSLLKRSDKSVMAFFISYTNVADAVFADSPLVTATENIAAGFVYSRYVFKSKRKAPR